MKLHVFGAAVGTMKKLVVPLALFAVLVASAGSVKAVAVVATSPAILPMTKSYARHRLQDLRSEA